MDKSYLPVLEYHQFELKERNDFYTQDSKSNHGFAFCIAAPLSCTRVLPHSNKETITVITNRDWL